MNTLAMTDKLQAAGIPERQARAQVEVLQEAMEDLVTKADMREMKSRLSAKMAEQTASLAKQQITAMIALTAIFAMIVKLL